METGIIVAGVCRAPSATSPTWTSVSSGWVAQATLSSAAGARVLMAPHIEGRTFDIHVDLVRPHEHHRQFQQPKLQMSLNRLKAHLNGSVGAAVRLMSHAKNLLHCKHSARLPMVCRREAKF